MVSHGILFMKKSIPPGFRWLHESFGTNWRMTEMQAAIGRIQLKRMNEWTKKRRQHAAAIDEVVKVFKCIRRVHVPQYMQHAEYKHYLFVNREYLMEGWDRDRIVEEINKQGIPCYQGSCSEVYLEKAFENTSFKPKERLDNAQQLGDTSLMFLVHPTLTDEEIEKICHSLVEVLLTASKK